MNSETIVRTCSNLLVHLAEPAARAIALGCLAAIVLGVMRVKRVPLRLFAWTTVLYGAVAIALVGWLLPGVPMRVPGAMTMGRIVAANQRVASAVRMMDEFVFAARGKEAKEANETKDLTSRAELPRTSLGPQYAGERKERTDPSPVQSLPVQPRVKFAEKQSTANPGGTGEADRTSTAILSAALPSTSLPSASLGTGTASRTGRASGLTAQAAITLPPAVQARAGQAKPVRTSEEAMTPTRGISWAVVATGIYGVIAFVLLARLLLGMFLSHRLSRLSETVTDADAVRKLRFRAFASGLETVPRMAESELVSVPATLGVARPIILLPAQWREWDEAKFDAILAHEVSHVARRDSLTQRISLIHRAIFWFSPLAWWLDRKLNELAEEASDEAALGAGADKRRYAETLLGFFADLDAASGRVWWQGVSMASDGSRAGHAEKRVERILAWGGSISMKKSLAVALVAIATPVVFLAAAVHPVVAQDKTQSDSKNVIMPGGPKAPALPNAPKGGVAGGVSAIPPSAGVAGGVGASAPADVITPSSHHPDGEMPSAPAPTAPPTGGVAGPYVTHEGVGQGVGSGVGIGNGVEPTATITSVAPIAPESSYASTAAVPTPQSAESAVGYAERQVRDAERQLKDAQKATVPDETAIREAEDALKQAKASLVDAQAQMQEEQDQERDHTTTITNGSIYINYGPRYVIMTGNSKDVSMSGSDEDLQHAQNLRKKINGDFIWFERDEKSYIITDPDFIAKAKALFAPEEALAKQQDELGRQQDELGRQQDALGEKMEGVKVKIRDITPELEEIRARLKELAESGATQEELGRLQSRLGQLQSEVGRSQSEAGAGQSDIGRQQGELGRKQGELGRRQGELGRQEGEIAKKASRQLRDMFDDAIANGIAKPE